MTRKIDSPTDSAGNVMWNAAVVANCQRDRSMKLADAIRYLLYGPDGQQSRVGVAPSAWRAPRSTTR
jgi:hypothetical protein